MNKLLEKNVIYEFYSDTCPPCRAIEKPLNNISEKYKDAVTIKRINTDADSSALIVNYLDITSVPTAVVIKEGQEIARFQGTKIPAQLDAIIPQNFF
jgi:thioredoxin 1